MTWRRPDAVRRALPAAASPERTHVRRRACLPSAGRRAWLAATALGAALTSLTLSACGTHASTSSPPAMARSASASARAGAAASMIEGPFDEVWVIATEGSRAPAGQAGEDNDRPGTGCLMASVAAGGDQELVPLPLERTEMKGRCAGPISSMSVKQRFRNPYDGKIEAVYVFPLPHDAAVSDFVIQLGERRIRGMIRERQEAERAYADARSSGFVAALLTQERPNIFTQKVANIEPGAGIDVEIAYYGLLGYEDGWHELVAPLVVGPRFNPPASFASNEGTPDGGPIGAVPRGTLATSGVDVHYLAPGERSRHEVAIEVEIDAGTEIRELESPSHRVSVERLDSTKARVVLAEDDRLPNRDFVLRWRVAGETPTAALVASAPSAPGGEGHFVLTLYPPADVEAGPPAPLELVFVIDRSGSMSGRPLAQVKSAMRTALRLLGPEDTFQIVEFSDQASTFGPAAVPADEAGLAKARRYVDQLSAGGGTMMNAGLRTALEFPHDPERLRYVVFLTDGYIGNETEVFGEVHRLLGDSRVFSFGVGSSVNRHLLDGMARLGRGATCVLLDREDAGKAMASFMERVRRPIMHDLRLDFAGVEVAELHPGRLPDLHAGRPVSVVGRCRASGPATIALEGRIGASPVRLALPVDFTPSDHGPALAKIWARACVADLALESLRNGAADVPQRILAVALSNGIMSPYTAFVAVDSSRVTEGMVGTTVHQAVPVPRGVQYETTVSGAARPAEDG